MRIGILTYWQTQDNYGQVLQGYALQAVLKDMGQEPYIIRYDADNGIFQESLFKRIAKILLYPIYIRRKKRRQQEKEKRRTQLSERRFDEFREKHFVFSKAFYGSLKELRANPPQADCYISGSDQVWGRLLSNPENEAYFLAFGDDVRRIAYACSFGMKEYPASLLSRLHENLLRFDSVSCREYDGVAICNKVGITATKVLDPTLIAPVGIYRSLLHPNPFGVDYAFIYSLNVSRTEELRWSELRNLIDKSGLKPVITVGSGYIDGSEIYGDVTYSSATVEEWLSNIAYARFVVTTSFHGTVFCILLRRPFAYVPLGGRFATANNRALDLLHDLGLDNQVLNDGTTYEEILSSNIVWNDVDARLKDLREGSVRYLKNSLK